MEIKVAGNTRRALETNSTIRCAGIFHDDYLLFRSVQKAVVIYLVRGIATSYTERIVAATDRASEKWKIKLNVIRVRPDASIEVCLDIFLNSCSKQIKTRVTKSRFEPIHLIHNRRKRKTTYVYRNGRKLDSLVAYFYSSVYLSDPGPLPIVADWRVPNKYLTRKPLQQIFKGVKRQVENREGQEHHSEPDYSIIDVYFAMR